MNDIARIFDAIDTAFGRGRQTCDYFLTEGDIVTVGNITYVVRALDFADLTLATANELAACLGTEGADVRVVPHEWQDGLYRVEPQPSIVRKPTQENGRQP
jgi:hypothetical protein